MIRSLIAAPFLILLVLFALSNTTPVALGLWPTDWALRLPLSVAVLAGMGFAFLAGAVLVWCEVVRQRHRARRAEASARLLEAKLAAARPRAPLPAPE